MLVGAVRRLAIAGIAAFAVVALGVSSAAAVAVPTTDVSIMSYEGFATSGGPGGFGSNLHFADFSGTGCASWTGGSGCIIDDNAAALGVPVQLIGKQNTPGALELAPAPPDFTGVTMNAVFADWDGLGEGWLVTIDFTNADQLQADWQIVKLAMKADALSDGIFVTTNLFTPTQDLQAAFISSADWLTYQNEACAKNVADGNKDNCNGLKDGGTYGLSHFTALGTPTTQVPEPTTMILLGLGLVGVGVAARKALGR